MLQCFRSLLNCFSTIKDTWIIKVESCFSSTIQRNLFPPSTSQVKRVIIELQTLGAIKREHWFGFMLDQWINGAPWLLELMWGGEDTWGDGHHYTGHLQNLFIKYIKLLSDTRWQTFNRTNQPTTWLHVQHWRNNIINMNNKCLVSKLVSNILEVGHWLKKIIKS